MQLDLTQIKAITTGAARVTQEADGFHFYRFTQAQETLYKEVHPDLLDKTFTPSGVKISFRTDSRKLSLAGTVSKVTARRYFAFDVLVNGTRIGTVDNFTGVELPKDYTVVELPLDPFAKEFDLGPGEKEVCVYFPWSVKIALQTVCLDDGAVVTPVKRPKTLLCFGDSITQGYDACYPTHKYVTQLADFLGADEYNKAIGAEVFFPELAALGDDLTPDCITVAYGTNDWSKSTTYEAFAQKCRGFYENLAKTYPNARIFAITPIWRKDEDLVKPCGLFPVVEQTIREATKDLPNVTVIRGYDFIPQDENLYGDLRLHPNDAGFRHYYEALARAIAQHK